MELTPESLVDYPLKHGVRGYRVEQVDDLLDRAADRLEELERRLREQSDELAALRSRVGGRAPTAAGTSTPPADDGASGSLDAPLTAQALIARASAQADAVLVAAHRRARQIDQDRALVLRDAHDRRDRIVGRTADFERRLRAHLVRHLGLLDELPDASMIAAPGTGIVDPDDDIGAEDVVTAAALARLRDQVADDDPGDAGRASDMSG
jgi:DivIVA domain-containing protein